MKGIKAKYAAVILPREGRVNPAGQALLEQIVCRELSELSYRPFS